MDGSDTICFWRGKAIEFSNPNAQFRWLPLLNDLAIGEVENSYEAGMIQIKMSLNNVTQNGKKDF